jgi:hypothetical protein
MRADFGGLDFRAHPPQNTANSKKSANPCHRAMSRNTMTPLQPPQPPKQKIDPSLCKHPQVQIVSRDEDAEYVECKECGEVFESSEFKDMEIEERRKREED